MSNILAKAKQLKKKRKSKKAKQQTTTHPPFHIDQGGKPFLNAAKEYARLDRGDPDTGGDRPTWRPWREEMCELLGEFRIAETYLIAIAQIGKSITHFWLCLYIASQLKLSPGYIFDQSENRLAALPEKFYPIAKKWIQLSGIAANNKETWNTKLCQIQGISIHLRHASTKATGAAAVGAGLTGFSADLIFPEERSQWDIGAIGTVFDRLSASRIPTQPMRHLGTPGDGGGIESDIRKADYFFSPHCKCPHCDRVVELNPKGTLLKPEGVDAHGDRAYLTLSGRPIFDGKTIGWYCHDKTNPVTSAYFGCPHCEGELDNATRWEKSFYQCVYTGITAREFLDAIALGTIDWREKRIKAGIYISPALRETETNLAASIIADGLNTTNPPNWQQQQLGLPSEGLDGRVSKEAIIRCIGLPKPPSDPRNTCTLAGIDQGNQENWIWIARFHLPANWRDRGHEINRLGDETIREVLWGGAANRSDTAHLFQRFGVQAGLIDCGSARKDAADLSAEIEGLELAMRKDTLMVDWKSGLVRQGGVEYESFFLHSPTFLKQVQLGFLLTGVDSLPLYRLPSDWERWTLEPNAEKSPIRHLSAVSRDRDSGKWVRPKDKIDDIYFAAHFCEGAFAIYLRRVLFGIRD